MEISDRELQIRISAREEAYEHRKTERFKLISSKRPILDNYECSSLTIQVSQVETLAENVRKEGNVHNLKILKNAFLRGHEYIGAFLRVNGALSNLVSLLLCKDAAVAVEACKCLTNMALGNHKTAQSIIKTAAPYLITFLHGGNNTLQNHSAWTLGNLASDCQNCRERLKLQGLLQALLHLLKANQQCSLESCTFALSVYTKFESSSNRYLCEEGLLKELSSLLDDVETSESTQFNVYCILFHLTFPLNEVEDHLQASGLVQKIVLKWITLCSSTPLNILLVTPLLRCIGNLCTGSKLSVTEVYSQTSFLDTCIQLFYSPYLYIRKETMWLLTNLAVCHAELKDLQKVLNHMERFLSENVQNDVSIEAAKFVLTTKKRFDELGQSEFSPELLRRAQNIHLSIRNYTMEN